MKKPNKQGTVETTIKLHRALWNWLANNPNQLKEDWPGWKQYPTTENHCFLCEYRKQTNTSCCLVRWESTQPEEGMDLVGCSRQGTLYNFYSSSGSLKERTKYAKLIAELKPIGLHLKKNK